MTHEGLRDRTIVVTGAAGGKASPPRSCWKRPVHG